MNPESIPLTHQQDYLQSDNLQALDMPQVLSAYNDLARSFREYVESHSNEYLVKVVSELQSENLQLKKEKFFLCQQLVSLFEEASKVRSGEKGKFEGNLEEMVLRGMGKEGRGEEEVGEVKMQLEIAKGVIEKQEKVIQDLKAEVQGQSFKIDLPELSSDLKDKTLLQADVNYLQATCAKYRECVSTLKDHLRKLQLEVQEARSNLSTLYKENTYLSKMQQSLKYENTSLKEILKDYEKINTDQLIRYYESDTTELLQKYSNEVFESNQKNSKLESENQKLNEKLNETTIENSDLKQRLNGFSIENNDLKNRLNEIRIATEKLKEELEDGLVRKDKELNELKECLGEVQAQLEEQRKKGQEVSERLEELKNELEEDRKNSKRVKNELESVRTVFTKRVEQLEKNLQGKEEEVERMQAMKHLSLQKLVHLIHQVSKIST